MRGKKNWELTTIGGTKLIITLLAVLYVMPAMADFMDYGRWGDHHMGFFGGFGMIIPVLLLIAVGYLFYQFVTKRDGSNSTKSSALNVLCERLAQGEIDTQTFNELKETIEKSR